jgi:hypothetical protein
LQEPAQAYGGAQFESPRFLLLRDFQSLADIRFGFILRRAASGLEHQNAAKPVELRFIEVRPAFAHKAECLGDLCQRFGRLAIRSGNLRRQCEQIRTIHVGAYPIQEGHPFAHQDQTIRRLAGHRKRPTL